MLPVGGTREAIAAEGIAAYKLFIGSLLDVTDNLDRRWRGGAAGQCRAA